MVSFSKSLTCRVAVAVVAMLQAAGCAAESGITNPGNDNITLEGGERRGFEYLLTEYRHGEAQ